MNFIYEVYLSITQESMQFFEEQLAKLPNCEEVDVTALTALRIEDLRLNSVVS